MTNARNTVFYIGVTNDLTKRVWQHKTDKHPRAFTARYKVYKLVHEEHYENIEDAIAREKQLKRWHRQWKINLITTDNLEFVDLSKEWFDEKSIEETRRLNREEYLKEKSNSDSPKNPRSLNHAIGGQASSG